MVFCVFRNIYFRSTKKSGKKINYSSVFFLMSIYGKFACKVYDICQFLNLKNLLYVSLYLPFICFSAYLFIILLCLYFINVLYLSVIYFLTYLLYTSPDTFYTLLYLPFIYFSSYLSYMYFFIYLSYASLTMSFIYFSTYCFTFFFLLLYLPSTPFWFI